MMGVDPTSDTNVWKQPTDVHLKRSWTPVLLNYMKRFLINTVDDTHTNTLPTYLNFLTLKIWVNLELSAQVLGFQAKQLHIKGESGIWWDDPWVTFAAIGKVWWAD